MPGILSRAGQGYYNRPCGILHFDQAKEIIDRRTAHEQAAEGIIDRGDVVCDPVLSVILLSSCAGESRNKMIGSESMPPMGSGTIPETETPTLQIRFEGTDLRGNTVSSDIFSRFKLTMINVWATYCNPCLREMPDLGELAAE